MRVTRFFTWVFVSSGLLAGCSSGSTESTTPATDEDAAVDSGADGSDASPTDSGADTSTEAGDPCATAACSADATCDGSSGTAVCTCKTGYSGDGKTCADVDECAPGGANDCSADATCTNTPGGFTCACKDGFTGDGKTCADVDECAATPSPCDAHATCANSSGGYTCTCNTGYSGDGKTCADVDECAPGGTAGCDANATCANTDGGFTCTCNAGYSGDGKTCGDVDECATNPCAAHATCSSSPGGASCTCNSGYSGDGKTCADVDECAATPSPCDTNATCANSAGGYTCTCKTGYSGDGKTCTPYKSCHELKVAQPSATSGDYVIDPDGSGPKPPLTVHCDMTSDGGVGYTMVKLTDAGLLGSQAAYAAQCADAGLEIVVPRTKAHAIAIRDWNGGVAPNVVNVYPKFNGAMGLSSWTGTCQGAPCSFYMADDDGMCNGEPNGDNSTSTALYRYNDAFTSTKCPLGYWNDTLSGQVDVQGWVICSTNDVGPAVAGSCKAYNDAGSVWNISADGITGAYPIDPDGTGTVATTPIYCDQKTDGGGWTLGFLKNSSHSGTYQAAGSGFVNVAGLGTKPAWSSLNSASTAAVASWLDLNTFSFTELRLGAYANGAQTYLSDRIAASSLRIQFGQNGYFLWDAPSVTTPTTKYFWCGGTAAYTDTGVGQVNKPAGAPDDCKNHGSLGSGWDFSQTGTNVNQGLTMCGSDASNWMYGSWTGNLQSYPNAGAAQAIWVR